MKYVFAVLMLVLLLMGSTVAEWNPCGPAQCLPGYHSVCRQECDPSKLPMCVLVCKCHCERN